MGNAASVISITDDLKGYLESHLQKLITEKRIRKDRSISDMFFIA